MVDRRHDDDVNTDDRADAAMRALFAEAGRAPMADERFTKAVMAKVEAEAGRRKQLRLALMAGLGSVAAALLVPHWGSSLQDVLAAVEQAAGGVPFVGAGAAPLVLILLAGAAGWAIADRA